VGHAERWLFANGYLYDDREHTGSLAVHDGRALMQGQLSGASIAPLPALTNSLVRRDVWASTSGFDNRYRHFDVYLWSLMMLEWDFAFLDVCLSVNRIHGAQVAVEARRTLDSAFENQAFWREFVAHHGEQLALRRSARVRNRLRGPSTAATAIAIEVLKHEPRRALGLTRRVPAWWWPLLPLLTTRAYRRERVRTHELRKCVPVTEVYP
jgi:hypothetical protein